MPQASPLLATLPPVSAAANPGQQHHGQLLQAHALQHEQAREQGNDAFALGDFDAAVAHYSRALALRPADAALHSNRAAAYLGKGW